MRVNKFMYNESFWIVFVCACVFMCIFLCLYAFVWLIVYFVCACVREHDCACLRVQFILVSLFANTNIRLIEFNESIGQVVPTDPKNRLVLARRATF